jgi:hypothetical protein
VPSFVSFIVLFGKISTLEATQTKTLMPKPNILVPPFSHINLYLHKKNNDGLHDCANKFWGVNG